MLSERRVNGLSYRKFSMRPSRGIITLKCTRSVGVTTSPTISDNQLINHVTDDNINLQKKNYNNNNVGYNDNESMSGWKSYNK